ncbi:MAG: sensor histidine kinase [Labilithrix sp.]|nr:sensor histidine kinase [Labilithrix sp.]
MVPAHEPIPVRREETDVVGLLRSSLRPLIEQAEEQKIELRVESMGRIPKLGVDPEKLAWAVSALVGNALRYVRRGTHQTIGGSVLVHVQHEEGSPEVAIAVQDDGPGIPREKLPFLFERRGGAAHAEGLALSLVREIVAAHRGRIEVESRTAQDDLEEHGTSITLWLPR